MRRPRKIRQDPIRRKLNYWVNWFSDAQYEQYREREEDEEDGLSRIVDEAELEALKRLGYDTTYVVLSDKSRLEILLRELWAKRPNPIKEVADQLGLEPDDPGDQETLLLVLADIVCAKEEPKARRSPGRRKGTVKWGTTKLCLLGFRYDITKRRHPKMSDRQIAKGIKLNDSSDDYRFDTEETIRQKLPAAKRAFADMKPEILLRSAKVRRLAEDW